MTLAHTYRFGTLEDHFHFGWEMGRIARALASGDGFANPFGGRTGPTAWVPPLYPALMAGVFKIFGIYSPLSAWVMLTLNSLFSAITALAIFEIATRCYGERVATWSAWLWCLHPAAMQFAVRWVWDTSLTAALFAIVLVLTLRMSCVGDGLSCGQPASKGLRSWLLLGLLWGLIGFSNSTLLLFLPINIMWLLRRMPRTKSTVRGAIAAVFVFIFCTSLWTFRNWKVFGTFVPSRSNLGVEMWAWNKPDATGIALGAPIEPVPQDPRYILYAKMGEIAYSRHQGALARAYIQREPGHFALLSLKRFYFFWAGAPHPVDNKPLIEGTRELNYCFISLTGLMGLALSIKNRVPASDLFAWALVLLPLTYYFVSVQARFRHPLEPLITICSVYLFQSAKLSRSRNETSAEEPVLTVVSPDSAEFGTVPILSRFSRWLKKRYFLNGVSTNDKVLEIGCGDGWVGRYLKKRGVTDLTDIDTTPAATINGDIRDWRSLGLEPKTFDVIAAFEVLEHVDCLNDCFELLKPGGRLLVTSPFPPADRFLEKLENWKLNQHRTSPHDHLTYFRENDLFSIEHMWRPLYLSQWVIFIRKPDRT